MANKRQLKKDIHSLLNDVIEEAYMVMMENPEVEDTKLENIIDQAADTMNDLLSRTNKGDKLNDKKAAREHYGAIKNELGEKSLEFAEKLNKLGTGK
jgi:cell division FtsZ-interacting protein ZapD